MLQGFDRLVVVSNRLPIVLNQVEGEWKVSPGSGGLVTALAPIMREKGGIWIGWPGTTELEGVSGPLQKFSSEQGYTLHPVVLAEEDIHGFYYGFSNEVLWPLFHEFQERCIFDPEYWQRYLKVNKDYAQGIAEASRRSDYVWVHDYHLLCVAEQLKKMGVERQCGFFLHIPFPAADIFLKLPWRRQIMSALLEYDLVGFQTYQDRRNFVQALQYLCRDVSLEGSGPLITLSCGDRTVRAGCFPISIDFDEFASMASTKEVTRRMASLSRLHPERQIILGVDRLDYTKGIPQCLDAMHMALKKYPELRGNISLLQVVVPSREGVEEYKILKEEIERKVGQINGLFSRPGWIPIHYMYRSLPRKELISFYLASDMALITPLRDGMNLVAKEYCACNYTKDGVLFLSEFAGAAAQLYNDAILINPHDVEGVAEAIRTGYFMRVEERRERMSNMRRLIKEYDIYWWLDTFLQAAANIPIKDFPQIETFKYLTKIDEL